MIAVSSSPTVLGDIADVVTAASTFGLAIIAIVSARVAYQTYKSSERQKNEEIQATKSAKAKEIWTGYLRLAFENSNLTRKSFTDIPRKVDGQFTEESEKYEWFVAHMFFAAEEILAVVGPQPEWLKTIKNQIRYYIDYIDGDGKVYNETYDKVIQNLIAEVVSERQSEQPSNPLGGSRA
ncbi:hypothetical protein [Porphyrobacter sp. ULC335]|uniref:hypothetical protein n=1 Tax=Porphyrobacter sp. ULC335 TaxID=2854260 RepID=UPI0022202222|nr:hypothetical protein [Porphyrobacter sp. ULC335]UYV14884.1 hypothetical protein KVF90_12155 [Porphyrobacter sp. ULC335]